MLLFAFLFFYFSYLIVRSSCSRWQCRWIRKNWSKPPVSYSVYFRNHIYALFEMFSSMFWSFPKCFGFADVQLLHIFPPQDAQIFSTHFFLHKRHKYWLEKLVAEHFIHWQCYRLDDILGPWQEIIASKIMWCNTVYVPISTVTIFFLFMSQLRLKSFVVPYKKQHNFCKTTHFLTVKNK